MNITLEHLPQCQATLHIEVPPDAVGSERKAITSAFLRQAKIPGYRPGKAPVSLIEKRFAKDIREELESRLATEEQIVDLLLELHAVLLVEFLGLEEPTGEQAVGQGLPHPCGVIPHFFERLFQQSA